MKKESKQTKILLMHEDGFTCREMLEVLSGSIGSIYSTLSKFKLHPNVKKCPECGSRINPELTQN